MFVFVRLSLPLLLLLIVGESPVFAQSDAVTTLEAGKPVERELKGGETHTYRLPMTTGQYLYAVTDQRGIDVVVTLYSPDGKKLVEINSSNGLRGSEPVWAITEIAGDYSLDVRSSDNKAKTGRYKVSIDELRPGVPDDKYFIAAQMEINEAVRVPRSGQTVESGATAKQKFDNAVDLIRRIENKERRAMALAKTAGTISDSEKRIALLLEAISLLEEVGKKSATAGMLLNLGDIQGNGIATGTYKRALAVAKGSGDKNLQAAILIQMGNAFFFVMADYSQALQHYKEALSRSEEIDSKSNIGSAANNIGLVYQFQGNYAKSLEYLEKGLLIRREFYEDEVPESLLNIGNIHLYQGNYDLALEYFQKALTAFEAKRRRGGSVAALDNIGSVYLDRGQYPEALASFQKAQEARSGREDLLKEPASILKIGLIYKEQGKYAEALDYFEKAMPLADKTSMVDILNGISDVDLAKHDYPKALEIGQQAATIANDLKYFDGYRQGLIRVAEASLGLGQMKEARAALELVVAQSEIQRNRIAGGEEEQQRFFETQALPYKALVGLSIAERKYTEAFFVSERMKSRTLLDVLQSGKIDLAKALSVEEREQEKQFRNELVSVNAQISKEDERKQSDKNRLADLRDQLRVKRLELEGFHARLYASHPELRVSRGEMKPIALEEVASILPDKKTAVVEFVVAKDKTFLFVINRDASKKPTLRAFEADVKDKDLGKMVEACRSKIAAGDLDFQKHSRELYDLLLKPAEAQLVGRTNLIVVPDGPLWDLPFQALMDEKGKFFAERMAISYAPSLTALREMQKKARQRKASPDAELLAFGNPIVAKETTERVQRVFMSEKLDPIPEAGRLVTTLGKMYGPNRSKVYTGAEACEQTAKTESPKFRIVQFATHGILNNASPMYSHLVLAQNERDPNEDGLLEAWEMKDLDLKADMVILSACDTARGKISNGEGVIGMSWALFIAGTPTTVASQWKVESSSTTELMLEFHRQLLSGKGISKAEALRRAELKVMRMPKYKHPSYWAGFVIVGDGS